MEQLDFSVGSAEKWRWKMTTTVNQLLNTKDDEIFSVTPDALVIDASKMMDAK